MFRLLAAVSGASDHICLDPIVAVRQSFLHSSQNDDYITLLHELHIHGLFLHCTNKTFSSELRTDRHVENSTVEKHILGERL